MKKTRAILVLLTLSASAARAQETPDPRAEALNEQGKTLYLERLDYPGAVARFRAAIAIRRDARYSYNLCAALEKLGDLEGALAACEEVSGLSPRPELADKASRRAAEIQKLRSPQAPTTPLEPVAAEPTTPPLGPGDFGWSLGADVGLVHNASVGFTDLFARNGAGLRLRGDFIIAPRQHIGLEPFIDLQHFDRPGDETTFTLAVFNLGTAVTWHQKIWESLYFTPSAGLFLSFLSVGQTDKNDTYATIGFRGDAGLEWVFPGGQHVVTLVPLAVSFYPAIMGQVAGPTTDAALYGLDRGGVTWSVFIGYRYRFKSALFPILY